MKNRTTFLYGLLLILLGIFVINSNNSLNTFSEYLWCVLGLVNIVFGFIKIKKFIN